MPGVGVRLPPNGVKASRHSRISSLMPQALTRVDDRCFQPLVADRADGDGDGDGSPKDKIGRVQVDPVGKILEPLVHGIPGQGPGNQVGLQHPPGELFQNIPVDPGSRSAHSLADTYFFCSLGGEKSG